MGLSIIRLTYLLSYIYITVNFRLNTKSMHPTINKHSYVLPQKNKEKRREEKRREKGQREKGHQREKGQIFKFDK